MFLSSIVLAACSCLSVQNGQPAPLNWHFQAVGDPSGIEILMRATHPLSDFTGFRTQHVHIYRGVDPHFAVNAKSFISTSSVDYALIRPVVIYTDPAAKLRRGVVYYYKMEGESVLGQPEAIGPEGLGTLDRPEALSSAATLMLPPLNVVFIGDSITYGANLHPGDPTPCDVCARSMELGPETREVFFSNEGHSGHTTKDFLPGGDDLTHAEASAVQLEKDHPGELVFSVMLGTNDSADNGPNGSPIEAPQLETNLKTMVDKLLKDFPDCKVVLNRPTWYSPNTHNGATYEEDGLHRLTSYFPVFRRLPSRFEGSRVFEGDSTAYGYFATHYLTTLNAEPGRNGTFYLHPNRAGAQALGELWAAAILRVVH